MLLDFMLSNPLPRLSLLQTGEHSVRGNICVAAEDTLQPVIEFYATPVTFLLQNDEIHRPESHEHIIQFHFLDD